MLIKIREGEFDNVVSEDDVVYQLERNGFSSDFVSFVRDKMTGACDEKKDLQDTVNGLQNEIDILEEEISCFTSDAGEIRDTIEEFQSYLVDTKRIDRKKLKMFGDIVEKIINNYV